MRFKEQWQLFFITVSETIYFSACDYLESALKNGVFAFHVNLTL